MTDAEVRSRSISEWFDENRKKIFAVLVLVAAIILIIGLCLSWFVNSKSLSTVGKIQSPGQLKVLGPNQVGTEPIEISYDESRGDEKDNKGNVTIRRAFCVQSNDEKNSPGKGGQPFELQVANTTNIQGLQINVYHVTVNQSDDTNGDVVGLDGLNHPYSWSIRDKINPIIFSYINLDENSGIAQIPADSDSDPTFDKYQMVQKNARPLYRSHSFTSDQLDHDSASSVANDATNFIIECTWNADDQDNIKETDMVYLIARRSSSSS